MFTSNRRQLALSLSLALLVLLVNSVGRAQIPAGAPALTADGNFGLQTNGNPVTTPWSGNPGGLITAATSAQSPFTNIFASNNIGATVGEAIPNPTNPYIIGTLPTTIAPSGTTPFYVNVDFQNTTAGSGGGYDFIVTSGANGSLRTGGLYVTGTTLYMDHSGVETPANSAVASLTVGTWYDAQLAFNPVAHTYTGTLTPATGPGAGIAIQLPTENYVTTTNPVNTIYTDGGSTVAIGLPNSLAPAHNIDNFAAFGPAINSLNGSAGVTNIDFNGIRGGETAGATFSGQGVGGGGTVFNGLTANSTTGNDNLTVSGSNLLNSVGGSSNVAFTVGPVGGDNAGNHASVSATNPAALTGDYIFDHSSGNNSISPFTISGINGTAADLYFYAGAGFLTVNDGSGGFAPEITVNTPLGVVYEFLDVLVVNGMITGNLGTISFSSNTSAAPGAATVIYGLSIVGNGVPEPSTVILMSVALVGLGWTVRRPRNSVSAAA